LAWPVEVVLISPHHPSCNAGIVNAPLLGLSQAADMSQMIGCRCTVALVHCSGRIWSRTQFVNCHGRQATKSYPFIAPDFTPATCGMVPVQLLTFLPDRIVVSALTVLVGRQEGHPICKKLGVWLVGRNISDWSFARFIAPVVTTTSIILSSNKIQTGDILVPANSGPSE